jgi:hypothetical protein
MISLSRTLLRRLPKRSFFESLLDHHRWLLLSSFPQLFSFRTLKSLGLGTLPDFLLLLKSLGILQKFEFCFEFVYLLLFHAKLFLVVAGFTPIDMLLHHFLDVGRIADDGEAPMLRLTDRDEEVFLRKKIHIFRPL